MCILLSCVDAERKIIRLKHLSNRYSIWDLLLWWWGSAIWFEPFCRLVSIIATITVPVFRSVRQKQNKWVIVSTHYLDPPIARHWRPYYKKSDWTIIKSKILPTQDNRIKPETKTDHERVIAITLMAYKYW